ncbi:hypothetical protein SDC9_90657 [bioreactor metagenome]|uniref:Uncharacterized protein n=1 Tax=bioreactor metagenome TaxID=1076179 RepID=A0A644ZSJ8_9ZZZZ
MQVQDATERIVEAVVVIILIKTRGIRSEAGGDPVSRPFLIRKGNRLVHVKPCLIFVAVLPGDAG